ncbi:MAG: HK97 gp10 family phage protein [Hyphomonadaceae bacterium]
MTTRFLGREKLKRRLQRLPAKVQNELRSEFAKGAQDIVAMQKRLAPIGEGSNKGALRRSITWSWGTARKIKYAQGGTRGGPLALRITAGNAEVRYAHIVEFGSAPHVVGGLFKGAMHPGTAPQPYFFSAYRARKKSFKARQRRAFRKAIIASKGA